ncbi:MAG: hypothetical protein E7373_06370 [Clostridiales bacterium]|nr:hypothetical protein [Clostridiales bacterium]
MDFVDNNVNEILNEEISAYEMAYTRPDAIERCYNLGEQFAKHFIKICEEGKGAKYFIHHCAEMQSWWDKVKGIKLKENNKLISLSNLTDWFFTLGKDPEDFIPDRHLPIYSKLYLKLLLDREIAKVQDILEELL